LHHFAEGSESLVVEKRVVVVVDEHLNTRRVRCRGDGERHESMRLRRYRKREECT
jgi:hypothetical protein